MKQVTLLLVVLLLCGACEKEKRTVTTIDFTTAYKLSTEIEEQVAKDTIPWKYQISAANYAIKSDYKNALAHWNTAFRGRKRSLKKSQIDSLQAHHTKVPAVDYIVEQAKKHRVVIINEAHHKDLHRAFTKSLLKKLHAIGYTQFGLEALSHQENIDSLHIRKYPVQKTGYYTRAPQFGNLLREAMALGYRLFPYETKNRGANGTPREIDQAKHIQQVLEQHPNEKILIHCGFDHALEGEHRMWGKAMAEKLKELTGVDPLTIDQVNYSEKSDPEYNHPLAKVFEVQESSVILDANQNPLPFTRRKARTDIAVFHPNTKYIDGKPHWYFSKDIKSVDLQLSDIKISYPILVLAYKQGENLTKAVPLDITEVQQAADKCTLALAPGKYDIVVTNKKQSYKIMQQIK